MAELNRKFHCKKNGVIEEITVYTTLEEVNNRGLAIKLDGRTAYMGYGDDTPESSNLFIKRPNDNGKTYRIYKSIKKQGTEVTLLCFDVETEKQISTVKVPALIGDIFYLDNKNAPTIANYDFVMMDGVKNPVTANRAFKVWYVKQSVPDRTKTSWLFRNPENNAVLNTYAATNFFGFCLFNQRTKTFKRINTSNVTTFDSAFKYSKIQNVPEMDTSKATSFKGMFESTGTVSIPWVIDFSSCTNCDNMFKNNAGLSQKLQFRNVPKTLSLANIGKNPEEYTVLNYI